MLRIRFPGFGFRFPGFGFSQGCTRPGPDQNFHYFFAPARFDPDRFRIFLARPGSTRTGSGPLRLLHSTVQYCPVLHSTVQYCTVLYRTVQYFLLVIIKKIKNAPRSAGWAKRVFDFFFTHVYTLYKKIQKNKTQTNSSFRRFLKKSFWNHFKKSETFTNRSGLKNQYQRWVSCTLFVGRMTISLKNIEISTRFSIFEGADFRNFRKSRFFKV